MNRPKLLDLYCGAGGCAMGYYRAGFDVVGVDIEPQPSYPFEFHQADATTFNIGGFDAVHASPPCQAYSSLAALHPEKKYPDLIGVTRSRIASVPYVIENVVGAPLVRPTLLCGSYFGLGVRRHRLFETSFTVSPVPWCRHAEQPEPVDVSGTGLAQHKPRNKPTGGKCRKPTNLEHARLVMGIDWMNRREISQAVPPAYTEYIGRQLMEVVRRLIAVA